MKAIILKKVRKYYNKVVNSIAFYPVVIALFFLVLSYVMLTLDFSESGKQFKSQWDFLSLKDASTARTIAATIAAGILSLTVFSFSMVMILLNQAASNMSNRVLDSMIGNRFQQWVLGCYIGTIVYALFLLSTIRDIDSGIYVPALSVYLLILLTIIDIFLFIYFLHYITQSVKFDTIIARIHRETKESLKSHDNLEKAPAPDGPSFAQAHDLKTVSSGYYQGFDRKGLMELCRKNNWKVAFQFPVGTYVLEGVPFLKIVSPMPLFEKEEEEIRLLVDFYRDESVQTSAYYGFKQLVEVALKALSPGINDPGTAVLSLHVLVDLLSFKLNNFANEYLKDEEGVVRIVSQEEPFGEVFQKTLLPIWDYGQGDRILRHEMKKVLDQLHWFHTAPEDNALIENLRHKVERKMREEE